MLHDHWDKKSRSQAWFSKYIFQLRNDYLEICTITGIVQKVMYFESWFFFATDVTSILATDVWGAVKKALTKLYQMFYGMMLVSDQWSRFWPFWSPTSSFFTYAPGTNIKKNDIVMMDSAISDLW